MLVASFYRILIFAWQSFWRNIWLSVATITIIILAVFSVNFLIVVKAITDMATEVVKNKVDVSVYFRPDTTESQVLEVKTYLSSLTQVKEINYVSQADALEAFRQKHQQDITIIQSLEELKDNPIGATLQIKAKNLDDYKSIVEVLDNSKYKDLIADKNFDDNQVYIAKIKNFSDNVGKIGLITAGVFILVALLIVFNTIRVAIYTHRQEINVMKLVGATNWFIRAPFLVEAIFYALIACFISILLLYPILNLIQPYLNSFFLTEEFSIINYFNGNFWQIFGLELLSVIFLNIISSSIAMRKYLRA
ncbi:MAG: permease-like cell division protein FtsX [Patescibacteria group bacterium]|jgi:cell division transport system permease protein